GQGVGKANGDDQHCGTRISTNPDAERRALGTSSCFTFVREDRNIPRQSLSAGKESPSDPEPRSERYYHTWNRGYDGDRNVNGGSKGCECGAVTRCRFQGLIPLPAAVERSLAMDVPDQVHTLESELLETETMIRAAFPSGIPEDEYFALLALLYEGMSFRTLATVMSYITGKPYPVVYNDVLGAVSEPELSAATIDQVRRKLQEHGYDAWVAKAG